MKRVVLISTFCDTEEKVDILIKNLTKIKKLNLDVFVYTPFRLRDQVYELSDLVLTSKENPVFDWPKKLIHIGEHSPSETKLLKCPQLIPTMVLQI